MVARGNRLQGELFRRCLTVFRPKRSKRSNPSIWILPIESGSNSARASQELWERPVPIIRDKTAFDFYNRQTPQQ